MISKDIIRQARQANLVAYLESKNYSFKQEGNRYRCKQHDSLIITNKNAYYWNSRQDHGNAIDFLVKHLNIDFKTAVQELTNTNLEHKKSPLQPPTVKSNYIVTKDYLNRAYAYLNKQRSIENTIISNLIEKGYLRMITGSNYKYPVIGFTILDKNKQVVGYELQGTFDKVKFKGLTPDVVNTNLGFNITIGKPKKAFFFESAIDLLSFYQLYKNNTLNVPLNSLNNVILVSMAGLKVNTLTTTLNAFKIVSKPCVCVDGDKAGTNFKTALKNQNIKFREILVPKCKDWNEYLKISN